MIQKNYRTIFFGTPDFSVPILEALADLEFINLIGVVTQPDKPVGRKQELTPSPVKMWAEKHNLPVWQPKSLRTQHVLDQSKSFTPDLCVVVAYGKIIPANLLDIPQHGWLNVHASLLPKYRGASPIQAAILNGEKTTGVTLMKIDAGLDTGPVIDQQTIMLDQAENFESLHDKLGQLGADIIKKSLLPYLDGKLPLQPQDNKLATLTTVISKEDGRIEWKKSANDIYRQIRAYTPWPGAYCFWKQTRKESVEQRLKILSAKPSNSTHPLAPGHIALQDSHLTVGCGGHGLILTRIQLEGKKPLPVDEFIKGYPEFIQAVLS